MHKVAPCSFFTQIFKGHYVSESPFLCTLPPQAISSNYLRIQTKLKPHGKLHHSLTPFSPTSNPRGDVYADVRYYFIELKTDVEFFRALSCPLQ